MTIIDISVQVGNSLSSGESIWFKILPPFLSGILSFGVAYFIFLRGQHVAKRKEKERLKEVREYFYITLLRFRIGINNQLKYFDEDAKVLKKDIENSISTFRTVSFSLASSPSQLLDISKNDTFKFLIQNENDKQDRIRIYSQFYDLLLIIHKITNQFESVNTNMSNRFEKFQTEIVEDLNKIQAIITQIYHTSLIQGNGMNVSDEYYKEMFVVSLAYAKNGTNTLETTRTDFIIPIKNTSYKYMTHPDSIEVILSCKNADQAYYNICEVKKLTVENIERWDKFYKEMEETISKIIDIEFKDFNYKEEILIKNEQ